MFTRDEPPGVRTRLRGGLHTSVVDNSSAFGFSITITCSFGILQLMLGSPGTGEIFGFGIAAALAFTLLQGLSSSGFRHAPEVAPREVVMLGTALNFLSVAVGLGAALVAAAVLPAPLGWPVGGFVAAFAYVTVEALELTAAAHIERMLGDPRAEDRS